MRAQASFYRLQTPPHSPTCQARPPAARAPARSPDPVGDRKVQIHLERAPEPGTAGAHPDCDPEPRAACSPISPRTRAPRGQSQAAPLRAPTAAARSRASPALAPPTRAPRLALAPAPAPAPGARTASPRSHSRPALRPPPHAARPLLRAAPSCRALPAGAQPPKTHGARPGHLKGQAPRRCCPEAASRGGSRFPREV